MIHLGDITKIDGHMAPTVDVVIGGSPCQDLSIAGKREGLAGARSGLFMEQIRIVREMREEDRKRGTPDHICRPRFMVWENVLGALSSNHGEDFQAVLEEIIRIAEPDAPDVPLPPKGRWPLADAYYGDGWSVAYRVFDAKFWGVPQRRRRIHLVADFGGRSAPWILFVHKSLCGNIDQIQTTGEATAGGAGGSAGKTVTTIHLTQDPIIGNDVTPCLSSGSPHGQACIGVLQQNDRTEGEQPREKKAFRVGSYYSKGMLSKNHHAGIIQVEESCTIDCAGGAPTSQQGGICVVQGSKKVMSFKGGAGAKAGGIGLQEEESPTLTAHNGTRHTGESLIVETMTPWDVQSGRIYGTDGVAPTLSSNGGKAGLNRQGFLTQACVRRLTPLECERLQGYPDGWTVLPTIEDMSDAGYEFWKVVLLEKAEREGKARISEDGIWEIWSFIPSENEDEEGRWENTHKPYKHKTKKQMVAWYNRSFCENTDSARYKAMGNSIALPSWRWVLKRISAMYEREATMASLFDGVGGFPLIWEQINGKWSCLWASEIELFPIAVTRYRFGDEA